MPRNCTVFILGRDETRSAILCSLDSVKWPTLLVRDVQGNRAISIDTCVTHYYCTLKTSCWYPLLTHTLRIPMPLVTLASSVVWWLDTTAQFHSKRCLTVSIRAYYCRTNIAKVQAYFTG